MSAVIIKPDHGELRRKIIFSGDLSQLTATEREQFYLLRCESLRLDPLSRPFDFLETRDGGQKKVTLYANASCTAQLGEAWDLTTEIVSTEIIDGIFIAKVRASHGSRSVEQISAVSTEGLQGNSKSNAMMKAVTKAERRAILRYAGLALPDESEVDSIPDARPLPVLPDEHDPRHYTSVLEALAHSDPVLTVNAVAAHHEELDAAINRIWQEHCGNKSMDAWLTRTPHDFKTSAGLQSLSLELKQRLLEHMQKSATDKAFSAWKCSKQTALEVLGVCARLQEVGIDEKQWREELINFWDVKSRKELSEEDARDAIAMFSRWASKTAETQGAQ